MKTYIKCICIFNFIVLISLCQSNNTKAQQKVPEQPTNRSNLTETTLIKEAGLLSKLSSMAKADTVNKNSGKVFQTIQAVDSTKVRILELIQTTHVAEPTNMNNPKLIQTTRVADSIKVTNLNLIQTTRAADSTKVANLKLFQTTQVDTIKRNDPLLLKTTKTDTSAQKFTK